MTKAKGACQAVGTRLDKRRLLINLAVWAVAFLLAALFYESPYRWINALLLGGILPLIWAAITVLDKWDIFHIWVAIGRYVRRQNAQVKGRGDENNHPAEEDEEDAEKKKARRIAWESLLVGGGSVLIACIASLFYSL